MEFWREWLLPYVSNQWVVWSLGLGFGSIILYGIVRAIIHIGQSGFRNWLKSAFEVNETTWWLIAVLIMLAATLPFMVAVVF
jgi:hypothetical protein